MKDHTIDEVVDYVLGLTPQGKWTMDNGQDIHFILTCLLYTSDAADE